MSAIFHFAFHVHDLGESEAFYCGVLGCAKGRSAPTWLDIDFFGNELSLHIGTPSPTANTGKVGDKLVPMPHYGAILPLDVWQATAKKLEAAGVDFVLPPQGRFIGEPGEQYTMFFLDPSGNAIELKGFADLNKVFAS